MAALSNYTENALVEWLGGNAFPSAPANLYLSLHTDATTDAGGGTEVSGNNYSRTTIAASVWSAAAGGTGATSNESAVTTAVATGSWGTITHIALWDASSAGNMIVHGALASSVTIGNGDSMQFSIGALVITFA